MGRRKFWDTIQLDKLRKLLYLSNEEIAERFNTTVDAIKRVKSDNEMYKLRNEE